MDKKKIRHSLGKKVGLTVFVFSCIYFFVALFFGGVLYHEFELFSVVRKNYSLARSVAVSVDQNYVTDLFEQVHAKYRELSKKYGDDVNSPEYLSEYDSLKTDKYYELLTSLDQVVNENSIVWINFQVDDSATGSICFVLDTDARDDGKYQMGWRGKGRSWKTNSEYPYKIIEDADDGFVIITRAPFFRPGDTHSEIVGYISVAEKRSNVRTSNAAFVIIYGAVLYVLTVCFIVISVLGIDILVVHPIKKLARAAESFRKKKNKGEESHFFSNARINSNDEIRVLADSMTEMENEIRTYVEDVEIMTRRQERMKAELDVASRIQARMLPEKLTGYNGVQDFRISATMRPAKKVGGDFYDFFTIDDDHIGLTIADVSDKGVPAALFMVVSKTLIKVMAQSVTSAAEVISKTNSKIIPGNHETMFITVFFGIYTVSERKLSYVNAGHEDPAVYRKSTGKYELIMEEHDLVIGIFDDVSFTERTLYLDKGDRLFLYTDGVPDAANGEGDAFGLSRMLDCLNSHTEKTGQDMIDAVKGDMDAFSGSAAQFDDITMLLLETDERGET
ncbi:MAG: PP2C family protein-serine/threonine phosphatase [Lachnospiraceae bacterium]|nr:PP2C family protein-serine/threonine phosphatase [Lachnospiraceae bacterium]